MYLSTTSLVVIDGRRYDFEFAGVTPSHRHTVTVHTKVESRLSVTRVYKKYPLFNSTSKVNNSYNRISTTYFYTLTPPQIPINYNPLFINKFLQGSTPWPLTRLPNCPCAGRATENQKPPLLVVSTYSFSLSLVSGCKNILPVQETSQDLTSSYLLLGGTTRRVPPRYDRDHRCSLVRRGEFLHQLYMEKAYVPRG